MPGDADGVILRGVQTLPAIPEIERACRPKFVLDCIEIPSFGARSSAAADLSAKQKAELDAYLEPFLKRPDAVWTVSDALAERLPPLGMRNVRTVANYRDRAPIPPVGPENVKARLGIPADSPCFLSSGLLTNLCPALLQAMSGMADAPYFVFFGGAAPAWLRRDMEAMADALGMAGRVRLFAPLPYDEMTEVFAGADFNVIFNELSTPNNAVALPNRLFDGFAAGLPTLALPAPETAKIIRTYDAGVVVPENRPDAWRAAIAEAQARQPELRLGAAAANDALCWEAHKPLFTQEFEGAEHIVIIGSADITAANRVFRIARDLRDIGHRVTLIGWRLRSPDRFRDIGVELIEI